MKKTLLKIGFVVVCIGLAIFLLLPFLETSGPVNSSLNMGQAEIATDNPLNVIAKRLASLFRRKEKAQKELNAQNNTADNPLMAGLASSYNMGESPAANGNSSTPSSPSKVIQVPDQNPANGYDGASFQTDDGEWVLIQQTAPQHSAPGMHEVNAHDNPYDRYVRQERAKHFAPQKEKQEIPDSKWARLVQPIKNFFGIAGPTPVTPATVNVQKDAEQLASLKGAQNALGDIEKNTYAGSNKYGMSPFPHLSFEQWQNMTEEEREHERERQAVAQFVEMLSGEKTARDAAEIIGDIRYPNPKNEQEKQEKENFVNKLTEENKQHIKEGILATMQAHAQGREAAQELGSLCGAHTLPSYKCSMDEEETTPPQIIEQQRVKNADAFFENTQYFFPNGLPVTPVLGPVQQETIDFMKEMANAQGTDSSSSPLEIIPFLYETQCRSNTCYWVANSNQADTQLADAVTMANGKIKTDPLNTYPTYREPFVKYKLDQLDKDATPEQIKQAQEAAEKQFDENPPAYVPYTPEQLKTVQDATKQNARPDNAQGDRNQLTVFYFTDEASIPQFAKDIDSVIFSYGIEPIQESESPVDASEQITKSMGQNMNVAKEKIQEVTQGAIQEGITSSLKKK